MNARPRLGTLNRARIDVSLVVFCTQNDLNDESRVAVLAFIDTHYGTATDYVIRRWRRRTRIRRRWRERRTWKGGTGVLQAKKILQIFVRWSDKFHQSSKIRCWSSIWHLNVIIDRRSQFRILICYRYLQIIIYESKGNFYWLIDLLSNW